VTIRAAHALLRRFGVDLVRYPGDAHRFPDAERQRILAAQSVGLILDVGANAGQFAELVRRNGYSGRIVSFEPLHKPFEELTKRTARDPLWEAQRLAIGARSGKAVMHVTANSWSSSTRQPLETHLSAAEMVVVGETTVPVATLDELAGQADWHDHVAYVKLDVQGAELDVLEGAERLLADGGVVAVEIEVSLVQLYAGQPLFPDVNAFMQKRGYRVLRVEPEFEDPNTGFVLQLNVTYGRERGEQPREVEGAFIAVGRQTIRRRPGWPRRRA
jgi:FkbM family methyltransferase